MRGLEEQTRGGGPFSGEEMLFIKLKSGECVCISAVEVGGAGFIPLCAFKQREHTAGMATTTRTLEVCQKERPTVMWQVRRQRLGEGTGTAVSPADESPRSQR